jgi:imidazoleglycerol-phosphate dehydratase
MRKASVERETKETYIKIDINLDGTGNFVGEYPVPYFKHLLTALSFYAQWDVNIIAKGDIEVDPHHLIEDTGIVLGEAFIKAIKGSNFNRFSQRIVPMDEALVMVVIDISGRPYFSLRDDRGLLRGSLVKEFIRAFVNKAEITLHIWILSGENTHHIEEAIFKGIGLAIKDASQIVDSLRSTKGMIL